MRSAARSFLTAAVVVATMGLAGASPEERPCVRWAMSWEAATAEAMARNVPIFVTFHKDQ